MVRIKDGEGADEAVDRLVAFLEARGLVGEG
jgi:hypothetical protein